MSTVNFFAEVDTTPLQNSDILLLIGKGAISVGVSDPGVSNHEGPTSLYRTGAYNGWSVNIMTRIKGQMRLGAIFITAVDGQQVGYQINSAEDILKNGQRLVSVGHYDTPNYILYENGTAYQRWQANF